MLSETFPKAYYVEWIDSAGQDEGWSNRIAVESWSPCKIATVGFLISESDDSITLAGSISDNEKLDGVLVIPKCSIKKKKRVRV